MTNYPDKFGNAASKGRFEQIAAALGSVAGMLDKAQETLDTHADNIETIIAIEDAAERAQAIDAFRMTYRDGLFDAQKLGEHLEYLGIALDVFNKADTPRLPLIFAELHGADLSWANLSGADLRLANLSEADLSGADLRGAKLHGAKNLTADQLSSANINESTRVPEELECVKQEMLVKQAAAPASTAGDDTVMGGPGGMD